MLNSDKETGTTVKSDIVDQVYEKVGFTRQDAEKAVDILLNEIKNVLGQGEDVKIVGFASFYLRQKKARNARNPKTGEPILIRARKVLTFKPSKQLLEMTNRSMHEQSYT